MLSKIQFRRGTAAQFTSADPTLSAGEPGFETDTGKFKIGDGTTAWTALAYGAEVVGAVAAHVAAGDPHTGYMKDAGTSVDNTLPRFDGTDGRTMQTSAVVVGDNGELSGYKGHANTQAGTTYEIVAADAGKVITFSSTTAVTCTVSNDLPADFCCTVIQKGTGQITFAAEAGGTLRNRQSHTKSAGQYAMCSVYVIANSGGSAAEFILGGDTAS